MFPIASNTDDPGINYVDSVFSTYLYTGNGSTQTINNGIDLAGKGGMVWIKDRTSAYGTQAYDTVRGAGLRIGTYGTFEQQAYTATGLNAFTSTGFSLGDDSTSIGVNRSGDNFVSWTFREAAKFFDVVTYTGNGVAGRQIAHSLGVAPGMVIVKRTDDYGNNWWVYHRSLGALQGMSLNTTEAVSASGGDVLWNNIEPTPTVFTLGVNGGVNASGGTYVAYLYAHDTSSTGIIQCGSLYCGSGATTLNTVNLGWEPQYVLAKDYTSGGNWFIFDTMRSMSQTNDRTLRCNTSEAEQSWDGNYVFPTATGFTVSSGFFGQNTNLIYMAIRRPNKPPTSGTQVYNAITRTGTGAAATVTGVGFAPDLVVTLGRASSGYNPTWLDKLRGITPKLFSSLTNPENTVASLTSFDMDGVSLNAATNINTDTVTYINHFFKRAPGFFDVVCYTGTGVANSSFNHNLGVRPELMIIKARTSTGSWITAANITATTYSELYLDTTQAQVTGSPMAYSDGNATIGAAPTATTFGFGYPYGIENALARNYVAYLFATLAGISKVGSYTGNGSSQTINCGFAAGARFILIKRTDAAGDWYVWDTTRGIAAANDPRLSLNTSAAEVTTDDSIDPDSTGFIVNQVPATNINVTSATYIFLAIS